MDQKLQDALMRWQRLGLVPPELASQLWAFETERASKLMGVSRLQVRSRLADFATYFAVATMVSAVFAMAPPSDDSWGPVVAQLAASAVSAGAAYGAWRSGVARAADAFAGAALFTAAVGIGLALGRSDVGDQSAAAWALFMTVVAVYGIGLAVAVRSPLAAIGAAAAVIALPFALTLQLADVTLEAEEDVLRRLDSEYVWGTLALVWAMAAGLSVAIMRRWLPLYEGLHDWLLSGISLTIAGCAMLVTAFRDDMAYDYLLIGWAAVFVGASLWRERVVWMPAGSVLLFASAVVFATDTEAVGLGLATLAVSLSALHPAAGRLPQFWLVFPWQSTLVLAGTIASVAMAYAGGGWPAAGLLWAVVLSATGFAWGRQLSFVVGLLAFYLAGTSYVGDQLESGFAVGVGLLMAGLTIGGGAVLWRRRFSADAVEMDIVAVSD